MAQPVFASLKNLDEHEQEYIDAKRGTMPDDHIAENIRQYRAINSSNRKADEADPAHEESTARVQLASAHESVTQADESPTPGNLPEPKTARPDLPHFMEVMKPRFPDVSDRDLHRYWAQHYSDIDPKTLPTFETFLPAVKEKNPGLTDREARTYWDEHYGDFGAAEKNAPSPGFLGTAKDMGLKAAAGVVDVAQSAVGLASLASGGKAGEILRDLGWKPDEATKFLNSKTSEAQQAADKSVHDAKGFVDTVVAYAKNPRAIAGGVVEAAPGIATMGLAARKAAVMIAEKAAAPLGGLATAEGAAAAEKAVEAAAGKLMWVSSGTEGALSAGQIADQAQGAGRQYSDYLLPSVAGGVGTALIGRGAGTVVGGSAEIPLFTGTHAGAYTGNWTARTAKSIFSEGFLEEMPQSAQEQVFQNIAMGKPWNEGVSEAAASGLVVGGTMGTATGGVQRPTPPPAPPEGPPEPEKQGPQLPQREGPQLPQKLGPQQPQPFGPNQPQPEGPQLPQSLGPTLPEAIGPQLQKALGPSNAPQGPYRPTVKDVLAAPSLDDAIEATQGLINTFEIPNVGGPEKRPSIEPTILDESQPTEPPLIQPGSAFTPRQEPEPSLREKLNAERLRLEAMRSNRPVLQPETPESPMPTGDEGARNAPLPSALDKAYPSIAQVKHLAEAKGVSASVLSAIVQQTNGAKSIDDLSPTDLQRLSDKLESVKPYTPPPSVQPKPQEFSPENQPSQPATLTSGTTSAAPPSQEGQQPPQITGTAPIEQGSENTKGSAVNPTQGARLPVGGSASLPGNLYVMPSQVVVESGSGDAKNLGDLFDVETSRSQALNALDTPSQRVVMAGVLARAYEPEILDSVVGPLAVEMVNVLSGKKVTAEMLRHHPAVLKRLLSVSPDVDVSRLTDPSFIQRFGQPLGAVADLIAKVPIGQGQMSETLNETAAPTASHGHQTGERSATVGTKDAALEPRSVPSEATSTVLATNVDLAAHEAATSPTNDFPEPTDKQKEAGNYKKGDVWINGLHIRIENPAGSTRSGVDGNGKPWQVVMRDHYGYIVDTSQGQAPKGKDKDHLDVFIKPGTPEDYSGPVFVVDQNKNGTRTFDEHKIVLGVATSKETRELYQSNYAKDWKGLGSISTFTMEQFKTWLEKGDHSKPAVDYKPAIQEAPAAQEVWQMTKGKFLKHYLPKSEGGTEGPRSPIGRTERQASLKADEDFHREQVEKAVKEGKPVPADVLKDYPDLLKKSEKLNQSVPNQGVSDGGRVAIKLFSDLLERSSLNSERFSSLDAETQRMMVASVLDSISEFKVREAIVRLVLVDVMDNLARRKGASEMFLHDPAVLSNPLSDPQAVLSIPVSRLFDSLREAPTFIRTEVLNGLREAGRGNAEGGTASVAGGRNLGGSTGEIAGGGTVSGLPQGRTMGLHGENLAAMKASNVDHGGNNIIADVGVKIGGARKDLAEKTGPSLKSEKKDDVPSWRKRYSIGEVVSNDIDKGKWIVRDTKDTDFANRPRQVGRPFDTKEEAEAAIPLLAVSRKHRVYKSRDGEYVIYRKIGDKKIVQVVPETFKTEEDAIRYMATHPTEILDTKTNFGEEILPTPEKVQRVGPDRRNGRNVTAEDVRQTFGLRAVEFGNWNNQDERQEVVNHAYDGLLDLAELLKIPAQAIGLNGDLALAFGARGQGLSGARAHYERNYGVINLTKMQGAGSLAHEWFHAADHYFGRQDTKASSEKEKNERGDLVYKTKGTTDYASHGFLRKGSQVRTEVREAYTALIQTMFTKAQQYVEDSAKAEKFVGEARARVEEELKAIRDSQYSGLSKQMDRQYHKRNHEPASAEQLAEFDGLAKQILDGELFEDKFIHSAMANKSRRYVLSGRWSNDAVEKISALYKAVRGRSGFDSQHQHGIMDKLRTSMKFYSTRLKMLADAQKGDEKTKQVPTSYAMEAKSLDQGRAEEYWMTEHEMAARAFSAYVEDKLKAEGKKSDFITYQNFGAVPTPWGWKKPYPEGQERQAINAAFDKLVDTLETKETPQGIALHQTNLADTRSPLKDNLDPSHTEAQAVQSGIEGKSVLQAAQFLSAHAPTQSYREIAQRVEAQIKQLQQAGMQFELIVAHLGDTVPAALLDSRGLTSRSFGSNITKVYIQGADVENFVGTSYQTVLHELIHAVTQTAVHVGSLQSARGTEIHTLVGDLRALYSTIARHFNTRVRSGATLTEFEQQSYDRMHNALKNPDELLAWGLTNPEMQDYLESIPYHGSTLWNSFVDMIRRFLGLTPKANTALSELLRVADSLMEFPVGQYATLAAQANLPMTVNQHEGLSSQRQDSEDTPDSSAFKRWFGDSKVVSSDGSPLVVYHGTDKVFSSFKPEVRGSNTDAPSAREGFFFTDRKSTAEYYSRGKHANTDEARKHHATPTVMAVYLSIKDPLVHDFKGKLFRDETYRDLIEQAKRDGRDGLILKNTFDGGEYSRFDALMSGRFTGENIYVAFNANQIKSATGNRGTFDESGLIYQHQSEGLSNAQQNTTGLIDKIQAQNRLAAATVKARPYLLGSLGLHQLATVYGKDHQEVDNYNRASQKMETDFVEITRESDEILQRWDKLKVPVADRMARVMEQARFANYDPDPLVNSAAPDDPKQQAVRDAFNNLPDDAKAIYRQARDFYSKLADRRFDAIAGRIERSGGTPENRKAALDKLKLAYDRVRAKVYFPFTRFGEHIVIARQMVDGVEKDREVSAFESPLEAQQFATLMKARGWKVKQTTQKEYSRDQEGAASKAVREILDIVEGVDEENPRAKDQLLDAINQTFIHALPDMSYAKHFTHAKDVKGFSKDALRAFAHSALHGAHHISRIQNADHLTRSLSMMDERINKQDEGDVTEARQVHNELTLRHNDLLNPNVSPVTAWLGQLGFTMSLGGVIATGVTNATQVPLVTLPWLGARYGFGKSGAHLMRAYKDFLDPATLNSDSLFDASQSQRLTGAERAMLKELQRRGRIDLTQTMDLSGRASQDNLSRVARQHGSIQDKIAKMLGFTFHAPEVMNRQVTALATYRMEMTRNEPGETPEQKQARAIAQAEEAIIDTHFIYTQENRPRYMSGNVMRVLTMFKQYGQNIAFLYGRSAQLWLTKTQASKEEKKIAKKQLLSMAGLQFAAAGALGMPFVGSVASLFTALLNGFGDDDDKKDWEVELRKVLADAVGKDAGEVLSHGVSRLTPWDMAARLGQSDLFFRAPQREREGRAAAMDWITSLSGPVLGYAVNAYLGVGDMAKGIQSADTGHFLRGVEEMTPALIRNQVKALRYELEGGIQSRDHHKQLDVTGAEKLGQFFGFAPARGAEMYEGMTAIKNHERHLATRRADLLDAYAAAYESGDSEKRNAVLADVREFNAKHRELAINGDTLLKSLRGRMKREAATVGGVYLPKKRETLRQEGNFANY